MRIQSKKGFTLVEAMVGMGILVIAMISGLTVLEMVEKSMKNTQDSLGYVSARNQLVSLLLDDTSWSKIVANNPEMSCVLSQNSPVISDRDCFGDTSPLVLYNIKGLPYTVNGVPAYNFHSAIQGFSEKGEACETFDSTAGAGNPACPYHVVVTWSALCSASPCTNPPLLFVGQTTFNGGPNQLAPNVVNLSFQVIKSRLYCPPIVAPAGHTTASADVDVTTPDQVKSNLITDVPTVDSGMTDTLIAPCRQALVTFTEDLNPAFVANPNNQSSVFIRDETTGTNIFEFRRLGNGIVYDYQLYQNGVMVVAAKPSWITVTKDTVYKFDVTNGLLRFCINDRCPHYFTQKVDFPFRMVFKPASGAFTPNGFTTINYNLLDL